MPFAWTPPGRVFVGIDLERTALLGEDGVQEGRGRWGGESLSHATFRSSKGGDDPLSGLPADVAAALGRTGEGALAVAGARGPVVLPVRWRVDGGTLYAALPAETLALAGAGPDAPVALTVDRASAWRARDMVGAMVQGTGADLRAGRLVRREDGPRARDVDRPRGRRARADRAGPPRLVEGLDQRELRRRSSMTTVEFSVEVDAPPERVWEVASDPANLPALGPAHRVGARPARGARRRGPVRGR